ncbi:MAG: type I 3-dehydroquinate dehydratase [Desulforhopalus sp.]|nr:type I 3-dehydroquinate dehydratase [Desulforhopalus sp.]
MRTQSLKQVTIRNRQIGGDKPLICLPLAGKTTEDIFVKTEAVTALNPDILEWRVDGYVGVSQVKSCLEILRGIRDLIVDIPLIFTCRRKEEGGFAGAAGLTDAMRLDLYKKVMETGLADIIDAELSCGRGFLSRLREMADGQGVRLIYSSHNFIETPEEKDILSLLMNAEEQGADIAKVAVTAQNYGDVLTLLSATNRARNGQVKVPMITISMGQYGSMTRLVGGLFGSDVTFGDGLGSSAPGQLPFEQMRSAMKLFYGREA